MSREAKLRLIKNALPKLRALFNPCLLCSHRCGINREKDKLGVCNAGSKVAVYSYGPHNGEEPPLSGVRGSGTIFFTHCNMKCVYCQNYKFSQESTYEEIETLELAKRMIKLKDMGCHNINLVSPTHYAYQIVEALQIAIKESLDIPVVYNTGGYDSFELVKLLEGIIDIYMPDMRYAESDMSIKYSSAPGYRENNRRVIKEMFRQVGPLKLDKNGIAEKGMIVRLLILPNNVSGTNKTLRFLKNEVSNNVYLSVMSQYHPTYKAPSYTEINRRINRKEHKEVVDEVERLGFRNGWVQGFMTDYERFLGTNIKPR